MYFHIHFFVQVTVITENSFDPQFYTHISPFLVYYDQVAKLFFVSELSIIVAHVIHFRLK